MLLDNMETPEEEVKNCNTVFNLMRNKKLNTPMAF